MTLIFLFATINRAYASMLPDNDAILGCCCLTTEVVRYVVRHKAFCAGQELDNRVCHEDVCYAANFCTAAAVCSCYEQRPDCALIYSLLGLCVDYNYYRQKKDHLERQNAQNLPREEHGPGVQKSVCFILHGEEFVMLSGHVRREDTHESDDEFFAHHEDSNDETEDDLDKFFVNRKRHNE